MLISNAGQTIRVPVGGISRCRAARHKASLSSAWKRNERVVSVERIAERLGPRFESDHAEETRCPLYPGTFDPPTLGHLDIVARAVKLVDHLVIGVAGNPGKSPLFSQDERVEMMGREIETIARKRPGRHRGPGVRQSVDRIRQTGRRADDHSRA